MRLLEVILNAFRGHFPTRYSMRILWRVREISKKLDKKEQ